MTQCVIAIQHGGSLYLTQCQQEPISPLCYKTKSMTVLVLP